MGLTNGASQIKDASAFLETLSTLFFDMGDETTATACRFHASNLRNAAGRISSEAAQVAIGRYIMEQRAIGRHREAIGTIDYLARHNQLEDTVDWPAVANLLGLTDFSNQGAKPR